REAIGGSGPDGTDAATLVRAGEWYGLRARGLRIDVDHVKYLPSGTVLHWELNHFVVFDRITRRGIEIVDPAMGPRVVPLARFGEAFTGIALVFEPGDTFERKRRGAGRFAWYLRQ